MSPPNEAKKIPKIERSWKHRSTEPLFALIHPGIFFKMNFMNFMNRMSLKKPSQVFGNALKTVFLGSLVGAPYYYIPFYYIQHEFDPHLRNSAFPDEEIANDMKDQNS